jgi:8-hydroxy-5-deazaflavin:NADPH oxidoreductase
MSDSTIAVVGGTGPQGKGLAYRFALAGHPVVVGSRAAERARATAAAIAERVGAGVPDTVPERVPVTGSDNGTACEQAGSVVLAVPYRGYAELLTGLRGALRSKVVVSCVNPLGFDRAGPYGLDVPDGSAAEEAQRLLPDARVVGAFHHLSAVELWKHDEMLHDEDVLVCGDDAEAKQTVMSLGRTVTGRDGLDVGALRMARQLEPLTAVLISVNKRYRVRSGVRLTGLDVRRPTAGV